MDSCAVLYLAGGGEEVGGAGVVQLQAGRGQRVHHPVPGHQHYHQHSAWLLLLIIIITIIIILSRIYPMGPDPLLMLKMLLGPNRDIAVP